MEYETLLREKLRDSNAPQAELEEAGVRMLVLHSLKRRVGRSPGSLLARVGALSIAQTLTLAGALSKFQSIADLETWLEQSPTE